MRALLCRLAATRSSARLVRVGCAFACANDLDAAASSPEHSRRVKSMRALVLLLLLSACDGEVLVDIDAGFPDAGVPDAGFPDAGVIDDVDAGFDGGCELEDVEFPFECEPDADWCSPRDQFHAYYDLAAGWSHQLDEETWVVEVRGSGPAAAAPGSHAALGPARGRRR